MHKAVAVGAIAVGLAAGSFGIASAASGGSGNGIVLERHHDPARPALPHPRRRDERWRPGRSALGRPAERRDGPHGRHRREGEGRGRGEGPRSHRRPGRDRRGRPCQVRGAHDEDRRDTGHRVRERAVRRRQRRESLTVTTASRGRARPGTPSGPFLHVCPLGAVPTPPPGAGIPPILRGVGLARWGYRPEILRRFTAAARRFSGDSQAAVALLGCGRHTRERQRKQREDPRRRRRALDRRRRRDRPALRGVRGRGGRDRPRGPRRRYTHRSRISSSSTGCSRTSTASRSAAACASAGTRTRSSS